MFCCPENACRLEQQSSGPLLWRFLQEGKVTAALEVIHTNASLLLVADISLSCQDLSRAMLEWKRDSTRLVEFAPLLYKDIDNNNIGGRLAKWAMISSQAPPTLPSNTVAIYDGDNNVSCHNPSLKALKQRSLPVGPNKWNENKFRERREQWLYHYSYRLTQ